MESTQWDESVGVQTLEAFSEAEAYNRWIIERLGETFGPRVLEVGSGIGNLTRLLLESGGIERLTATDLCPNALAELESRLDCDPLDTCVWNSNEPLPEHLSGQFDTVICSNVLEHVEKHAEALGSMAQALAPGGLLHLLVPAGPAIFSKMDHELGHFRRYRSKGLRSLLTDSGFRVQRLFSHNAVGTLGWIWEGKVLRRAQLNPKSVRRFDHLVPFLKRIDPLLTYVVPGVSLIAIAEKVSDARPA